MGMDVEFDKPEDLESLIDTIGPLRREGLLQQSPSIGNWLRAAAVLTTRRIGPTILARSPTMSSMRSARNSISAGGAWASALWPRERDQAAYEILEKAMKT